MFSQCILFISIPLVVLGTSFGSNVSYVLPNGRIIGGRDITIEEIPYQVSVQSYGKHICGGAIISEKYIITAGHCSYRKENDEITVRVNTSLYQNGGDVHRVKTIYVNPKYNSDSVDYDVGILELAEPVVFGSGIQKIRLPLQGHQLAAGSVASVSGWGKTREDVPVLSDQLQIVDVQIVDRGQCDVIYRHSDLHCPVTDRMLCAGAEQGGKDHCHGDSGGPLVNNGVLYGLVSWGIGCGRVGYPGVYSDVSADGMRDFIYSVVQV